MYLFVLSVLEIQARTKGQKSSGMDQGEDDYRLASEKKPKEILDGNGENSCSSSTSSCESGSEEDNGGGDSNSVASAPSQLGDSEPSRPHTHSHRQTDNQSHHGNKKQSVRGCACRRGGGKCSVRLKYHRMGRLTVVQPEDSLYTALRLLAHCKLHRLPVFEDPVCGTGNPLFVLTHRSLLAYLYRKQIDLPRPRYLQVCLGS